MTDPTDTSPSDADTHRRGTERAPERRVYTRVTEAVAEAEGIHPFEVASPLESVVDAEALDRPFAPRDGGRARERGLVRFPFEGI